MSSSVSNSNPIDAILSYWFGTIDDNGWSTVDNNRLWFGAHPDDDADMHERFGALIEQAIAGHLNNWPQTPKGGMALILLTDQMTRATRRGSGAAFAGDSIARGVCLQGIAEQTDKQMPVAYRRFYYLPLEHSEDLADQEHCVRLFQSLLDEYPNQRSRLEDSLLYAIKHRDIIATFGRFPHRNPLLGRSTTAAEQHYLETTQAYFGQSIKT